MNFGIANSFRAAALLAGLTASTSAFAQANSLAGTWEFHPEKSAATTAPLPKSMKLTFADAAGTQMTVEGIDAKGQPVKATIPTVADGKPHPVAGVPDFDTATLTKFNDTTTSYNYQKRKSTVILGNRVLSRDGNILTMREQIFNANGKQLGTTTMVFAKPGFDFASIQQASAVPAGPAGTMQSPAPDRRQSDADATGSVFERVTFLLQQVRHFNIPRRSELKSHQRRGNPTGGANSTNLRRIGSGSFFLLRP